MSSGDPLVFLHLLFNFPASPVFFFLSDSQLFIVFACAFFLLFSALVQYFSFHVPLYY